MDSKFPGKWQFPTNLKDSCIYRVPNSVRSVKPEAYTPELVLLGPLNHSLRSQASKSLGDITNTKLMGYLNMEAHTKIYLKKFIARAARRLEGAITIIDELRCMIVQEEKKIRESYSESTAWIESQDFVDMILHDCGFILELISQDDEQGTWKTGDLLFDVPCLAVRVKKDLILLENQLPYFIIDKLYKVIYPGKPFCNLVFKYFGLSKELGEGTKFLHFTALLRCVRVGKNEQPPLPSH